MTALANLENHELPSAKIAAAKAGFRLLSAMIENGLGAGFLSSSCALSCV
jgi:hypothetical protein